MLASLFLLPGCGMLFQLYSGYDHEEQRFETETTTLQINSLPRGAVVYQLDGDQRKNLGTAPVEGDYEYQTEVTVTKPEGMLPYFIGSIVDLGLVIGIGLVLNNVVLDDIKRDDHRDAVWAAYTNLPLLLIGEVIAGVILAGRKESVTRRRAVPIEEDFVLVAAHWPEVQVAVELPTAGTRLTIPLDPRAAMQMNRIGAPVTIVSTHTTSTSTTNPRRK